MFTSIELSSVAVFKKSQVHTLAILLIGFLSLVSRGTAQEQLFPYCNTLKGPSISIEAQQKLEGMVSKFRSQIESQLRNLPYEKPTEIAKPSFFRSLGDMKGEMSGSWRDFKIVASEPPPFDGSIYNCAVVLNCNLQADELAPAAKSRPKQDRRLLDGIIRDSVVIVNGSVEITGYIYNSIVISTGPIRLKSYIYNSFVVSCYEGSKPAVDVTGGYLNHCIVVAKHCKTDSVRDSIVIGRADNIRSEAVKEWHLVSNQVESLGASLVSNQEEDAPPPPVVASGKVLLSKLLASEEQTEAALLADRLAEYTLTDEQVGLLIEAAKSAKSDALRNLLWHAIRLSRDFQGRAFLIETLPKAPGQALVTFLKSMRNLSPFDVPILIAIYNGGQPEGPKANIISDANAVLVDMSFRDWSRMTTQPGAINDNEEIDQVRFRATYDRRQDDATNAQIDMLRWMLTNGREDSHRIKAYHGLQTIRGSFREEKVPSHIELLQELLDSSADPKFRATVVESLSVGYNPEIIARYLNPAAHETDIVRLAAIKALRTTFFSSLDGVGNGAYIVRSGAERVLERVAAEDEAKEVRQAATALLEEIRKVSKN